MHKVPSWMPEVQVNETLGRVQAWWVWETKAKRKETGSPQVTNIKKVMSESEADPHLSESCPWGTLLISP